MSCTLKSLIMVYIGSTGCARAWAWCEPFIDTPFAVTYHEVVITRVRSRFTEQAWSFSPPPPHVHAPCLVFAVFWLPTFAGQYSYISITFGIVNLFIKAAMRTKRRAIFLQPINCVVFLAPQTELNTDSGFYRAVNSVKDIKPWDWEGWGVGIEPNRMLKHFVFGYNLQFLA